jgi:radical SAM protein with 4Fe4S-binding SPASM domain
MSRCIPPKPRAAIGWWPADGGLGGWKKDSDGNIGKSPALVQFKKIYIEITNSCNLSCNFCLPIRRIKSFIAPDAFAEILQKVSGFTEYIYLHVLGEPLLHPDLGLLLDIGKSHGFHVNLTTNGTLLAQKRDLLLAGNSLRQINISLHSIEQFGTAGEIDLYLDGVMDFIKTAGSPPPVFINLRLWNLHSDKSHLNKKLVERLAAFFGLHNMIPGDCMNARNSVLAPGVFLSRDRQFVWPHAPAPDLGSHGYCRGLKDHIAILVDGTVVPCCLDAEADIPLGNLHQHNLIEILAAPRAAAMRKGFSRQQVVEPLCRRCTYRKRFSNS